MHPGKLKNPNTHAQHEKNLGKPLLLLVFKPTVSVHDMSNDVPGSVIVSRFKLPFLEECPEDWGGIYFGKWHLLDFHFHLNRTISGESGVNSISCCLKAHLVAIETRTRKAAARVNALGYEHQMGLLRFPSWKSSGPTLRVTPWTKRPSLQRKNMWDDPATGAVPIHQWGYSHNVFGFDPNLWMSDIHSSTCL